jgi:hypothetical protein
LRAAGAAVRRTDVYQHEDSHERLNLFKDDERGSIIPDEDLRPRFMSMDYNY